ncbi:11-oxo-beta-amyrin 30-oxidase-like [Neltuma alba]|uniref:11-oxo-beta-amyrin 30-oxidase-like n=1 Tax=Neltuma alba TaxID=207710 RepID=UPI0010A45A86|nr:11-oxo-beta-amyrin 30-oxidase-like [Prosopis alba]
MFEASVSALLLLVATAAVITVIRWGWKMVERVWLNPKRLERELRKQNLKANPYRLWFGDLKEMVQMQEKVTSISMSSHSHDLPPYVVPFVHHLVNKYGKNSFMWFGTTPRVILMDPEQVKEAFNRNYDFPRPEAILIVKYMATGVANYEDEKWAKHRKIINPAFHSEQLKALMPSFSQSCNEMIRKWEDMLSSSSDGTCEMDVRPWLKNFTEDAISRTAFGSNYEEGRKIFQLLSELGDLIMKNVIRYHNSLWSVVYAKEKRRMKEINRMLEASLMRIIEKKEKAMKLAEAANKSDLLGIILESNHKDIKERGNKNNNVGLSMKDVIEECKLFYFAGQETSSSMLAWTMMLLAKYPDWQVRAREEVLRVFGNQTPDHDGLSRLKILTMILYEVLRLYPPAGWLTRCPKRDMKLGNLLVPAGVQVLLPILMLHHDKGIWGDDAGEFKPERFSEGISKAGKGASSAAFFPFGWGPRICIGLNFALLEAKMVLSLILQRFCFELSPTYSHAPHYNLTIQPRHGVHIILHKL